MNIRAVTKLRGVRHYDLTPRCFISESFYLVTFTVTVNVFLPDLTVILAVPAAFAVMTPLLLTVAILLL